MGLGSAYLVPTVTSITAVAVPVHFHYHGSKYTHYCDNRKIGTIAQHYYEYHYFRSIRCASQNTETVIQTFRQPTAAFISE